MACVATGAFATQGVEARPSQDFELKWRAPPHCPGLPEITKQIQTILESAPGATLPSGLTASGAIEPAGDRYRLTLKVRVGENEYARVITADDCSSLGKATAVVLSLLIRRANESGRTISESDLGGSFTPTPRASLEPAKSESSRSEPAQPEPARAEPAQTSVNPPLESRKSGKESSTQTTKSSAEPASAEPASAEPASAEPASAGLASARPASAEPERLRLVVSAPIVAVDFLALPKTAVSLGGSAGAYYSGWRLSVLGLLGKEQQLSRAGLEPYDAKFSRSSLELWGCRGWRAGDWELAPCALLALDVVRASASGDRLASQNGTKAILWGGAGVMGFWHLSRPVRLFLSASGRISVNRTDFLVIGLGSTQTAHSVPFATVTTSLGTEFLF